MREAVQKVVDIQMERVTEKVKEKMYDLNEDQWAFRKQQLWALKTQVKEQRDKASKAECVVGWPSDATASQRAFFLSWRIQSAGVEAGSHYMSHATRPGELPPMSVVTFSQSWMRTQLDKWYKDNYITPKNSLYFYKDGSSSTNKTIKSESSPG